MTEHARWSIVQCSGVALTGVVCICGAGVRGEVKGGSWRESG